MPPSSITEVLVSDTGTSPSDNITSNAALTGVAAPNTVVTIKSGATTLGTVTSDNGGTWSYTPTLPDGRYTLIASETTLGTLVQTAYLAAQGSGATTASTYTVNQQNASSITAIPNSVVTFTQGATTLGTATVDGTGHWSFGYALAPNDTSSHPFQAHISSVGNVAQTATLTFTLETVAPDPTIILVTDSGVSSSDHTTDVDALKGTAAAYSTIVLTEGSSTLGTVTADASGTWSFTPLLADGHHTVTAFEYTPAGHTGSETLAFTLDTVVPAVYVAIAHDTGPSPTDGVTSNPELTGTAEANSLVVLGDADGLLGTATANANGSWSFTPTTLADGEYMITAYGIDAAGNIGTDTLDFTLESTLSEVLAHDTGVSPSDHITSDAALTGVANANAVVVVSNGATVLGSVTADANGIWSYTPTLADGSYTLTASRTTMGTLVQTAYLAAQGSGVPGPSTYTVNQGNASGIVAIPNSVVTFTQGATTLGTATVDGTGHWSFGYTLSSNDSSSHPFQAHISSIGNIVAQTATLSFTLETVAPEPTIVLVTDSGVSSSDHTTSVDALRGTAAAYSTIVLTEGASTLGTATADASGSWSFTPTLADGNHTVTAFEYTPAGHTSLETLAFTLDTVAPAVYVALAHDTGPSAVDAVTSNPQLLGTAEANGVVTITSGATTLGTATASAGGSWSFTPTTLADGAYTITASETDSAGNTGTDTLAFTMASTIAEALAHDTGTSPTDRVTANPALTGVANALALVTISDGATTLGSVTADAGGLWSYNPTLADGSYTLTASEVIVAGATTTHTATLGFVLETAAPAPTVTLLADTGASASDHDTANPRLTGQVAPGSVVTVLDGATTLGSATADAGGSWAYTPTLADGGYLLTAVEATPAGHGASETIAFTLDTAAPVVTLALAHDTGPSAVDAVTSNPQLLGTAEANGVVTITSGATTLGTATASAGGSWSFTPTTLADGAYTITASETDSAGNTGTDTLAFTMASTIAEALAHDTGTSPTDRVTANPALTGVANALALVTISDGATTLGSVTADAGGLWSYNPTLADGSYTLTASEVIVAGATTTHTATLGFVLETAAPAPTVTLLADTGASASDHDTANPRLTGQVAPGSVVTVLDGATTLGSATADAGGSWAYTPTLADGGYLLTAVEATPAGHGASETIAFTLDTAAPVVTLALAHDTGPSAVDAVTSNPQLLGTAEANGVVTITSGATTLGTATASAGGSWSFTPTTLADGAYTITASETDSAGNTGTDTLAFTMASTIAEALAHDTGTSPTDRVTANPALTGVANALALVTISDGATTLGSVTADAGGLWSYNPTLADGSYTLTASEVIVAGATTTHTATLGFVLETAAPAPTVTLLADTGASASDHDTANPRLTGQVAPGSVVTVLDGATTLGSATADAGGSWAYTPTLADGGYLLTAVEATPAGHGASETIAFTLDTAAPVVTLALAHDTGPSAVDAVTSNPQLLGTAEANGVVTITSGATTLGTATASAGGSWSFTPTALADGAYTITASETDSAGNTGTDTLAFTMASTIAEALAHDTGTSPTDRVTANPALTGVANALALVTISDGATTLGSVTADAGGLWSYNPTLADGSYTLTASEVIVAGATTTHTATLGFVLETAAPAPTVTLLADTGASASDHDTANPRLTGQVAPGSVVTVLDGATTLGSATADAGGSWAYTPTLADGGYLLTAVEATPAGHGASETIAFTLDTAAPVVTLALAHDTGPSAVDAVTSNPQLLGTAEANGVVTITSGATTLGTATASAGGSWSFTPTTLADGAYTITASETDSAGNTGTDTLAFTMASTIAEALAHDTGTSPTDRVTANPALTGVANALALVTISDGATTLGSVTADAGGLWSYNPTLADGSYTLTASEVIVAGATTTHTATLGFVLETAAPAPTVTLLADTGASASDHDTANPRLTGQVAPGSVVTVLDGATTLGSATADAGGSWAYTPTLADGGYLLTAVEATPAGHGASETIAFTLDTAAPVVTLALAHDTGPSAVDAVTSNPQLLGTAEANGVVTITSGATTLGTATASAGGSWSFTPTTLADGAYTITASETDSAGNTGTDTLAFTMASTIAEALAHDTGTSPTDRVTANPALTGVANALALVTISDGATTLGSVTADAGGLWSYNPTLADGSYTLTASEVIVAGATTTHTATLGFVLETAAPAPTVTLLADTGASASDHDTANPRLTGQVAPGSVVTVLDGATTLGSATADAGGSWAYTPTLADGGYLLTAVEATPAGHGASETIAFTLDTAAPVVTLALAHDTGPSAVDAVTSNPQLLGTAEANGVVTITSGATTLGTATASAGGSWSFTPTTLADGAYTITASETDSAGNTGTDTLAFTMASTIAEALAHDTGTSPTDRVTANPALTGVANALALVTISDGATTLGSVTADAGGLWSYNPTLADGSYTLTASEVIVAGATTTHTATLGFVLETAAPAPTVTLLADTGASASDHDTANPRLTGQVAPGSVVTVLDGATTLGSATADAGGSWAYTPTLADGGYLLTAVEATPAGHGASETIAFTLDTAAPVVTLALAHDTGPSAVDAVTSNPQLLGTAEANGVVTITSGATTLGTATASAGGSWSFTPTTLADGAYTITASETDSAGNTGTDTLAFTMASTIAEALAHDTGTSPTDRVTANPALTGVANALALVTISDGATTLGSVTADAGGLWSYNPTLADGSYTLTASEVIVAGATTTHTATLGFVLETAAPAPTVTLLADTGASASDHDTANPRLTGQVAPGSVVTVLDGATTLGSATADAGGSWAYTPTLADGGYLLTAVEATPAGHGASETIAFTLDTAAPVVTLALAHDTGPSAVDAVTSNPQLLGTAEANGVVTITSGATTLGTATASAGGSWSFTPTALADGAYTITASETDSAGNTGTDTLAFTMASTIAEALAHDTGTSPTDRVTANPALTGVANALALVTISDGATTLGSVTADAGGLWSYNPTLADGSYTLTASEVIVAGATTTHTATLGFVLETAAPAPTVTLLADTGASASDHDTANPRLTGQVAPGSVVTVLDGATTLGSATADAGGSWAYTPTLADGGYLLTAVEATPAGHGASETIAFTLDTAAPVVTLALAHDTGPSAVDAVTSNPQLLGTAEANGVVTITSGATTLGTATASAGGSWSFTPTTLADGAYTITASETDSAGNTGTDTLAFTMASTIAEALAHDTGTSPTDRVTANPALTGVANALALVTISDGATTLGSVTADAGGLWSYNPTLADGSYTLTASEVIVAGATTTHTATLGFVLETAAPAPTVTLLADTGASASDHDTANPRLTGQVAPGSVVTVLDGATTLGSATADAGGSWAYTPTLADGGYLLTAVEATPAGHGASETIAFTLDTAAPVVTLALAHDTGPSAVDAVTSNPQLLGTAEANGVVTITSGATTLGTATASAGGSWSFTPTTLADGAYTITASETDSAGNTGTDTLAFTMASTIAEALAHDTGTSPTDRVTANPALTGVANALALVTISDGATTLGSVTADAGGLWSYNPTLADGSYTLTASEVIVAGATTTHTATLGFVLETAAPAPTVTLLADTGASASDHDTANPRLTGQVAPGSVVTVLDGATTLGSATADAGGSWAYTPTLADGGYLLTAVEATPAGHGASETIAFTLDTAAPVVTLALAHDTGPSAVDAVTSNPQLLGTAEANGVVTITSGATTLGTATASAGGSWSFTPTTLADGAYTITASETDSAGNTGTDTLAFTMASTIAEALAHDTGTSPTDRVTANPALTGVANALALVTISDGATTLGSVTADAGGLWSYNPTLADGSYTLTASEVIVAGATTTHTATLGFVLETAAPAPTVTLLADTGASASDHDTANPRLTGQVAPGSVVTVLDGATTLGSATADAGGSWAYTPTLADGGYLLTAVEATPAGHGASETIAFTLDTAAPVVTLALAHDTGPSAVDAVTSNPQLLGTAEANGVVTITSGATTLGTATASAGGSWSFTPTTLADGAYTITASETDSAGNTGTDTLAFTMASTIAEALAHDTGTSPTDRVTANPALTGVAAPGSLVTILNGNTTLGSVLADAGGLWSYTPTLADGSYTLTALKVTPVEYSASTTLAFTLDTTAPARPTLDETVNSTDPAKPTLDGTAPSGSVVTLYDAARMVGTASATAWGAWIYSFGSALSPGTHVLTSRATDAAGNVSASSDPLSVQVNPDNSYAAISPSGNAGNTTLRLYNSAGQFYEIDTENSAGQLLQSVSNTSAMLEIYDDAGTLIGTVTQPSTSAISQPIFTTFGKTLSAETSSGPIGSRIDLIAESNIIHSQGNDSISAGPGSSTVFAAGATISVTGGSGNLLFAGTTGTSTVTGGTGTSTVFGGGGGGWLQGGSAGGNVLVAGGGNTTLLAGGSGDVMVGSAGSTMITMRSQDTAFGGGGATTMVGGGNDVMVGGSGNSVMVTQGHGVAFGGSGASSIFGSGNDVMVGGSGSNLMVAGDDGNSELWAGSGSTTMFGGDGGDIMVGGTGSSTAYGGAGNDSFFANGGGAMTIKEGSGNDEVMLGGGATTVTSGSGIDLFDVIAGEAGGASMISGFKVGTDQLRLFGYDLNAAQQHVGGNGLTLTLSDNTRITLLGVSNVAPDSII